MEYPIPEQDHSLYKITLPRKIWDGYRLVSFESPALSGGPICMLHTSARQSDLPPRLMIVWLIVHPAHKLLGLVFGLVAEAEKLVGGDVRLVPRLLGPDEIVVSFDDA